MDDRELLEIKARTIFLTSGEGRILRQNDPDRGPAPRFYLAGCATGNLLRLGQQVGDEGAAAIAQLVADEPALSQAGATPVHLRDYTLLLGAPVPLAAGERGLIWELHHDLGYRHPAPIVRSGTAEGARLVAGIAARGMPAAMAELGLVDLSHFWEPWCAALNGTEIAAVAFAARLGAAGAELGLATVPAFRGRGYAAAATAGWAAHPALAGRALFYSTSMANLSSQRVTARLGLRFIGASFAIA